jgi:superfamily II DNA helicase RecQ
MSPSTGSTPTMIIIPTAITASQGPNNPPALDPTSTILIPDPCQALTECQRKIVHHVMTEVWGILEPREFQVQAIIRLVFQPKTCLFLIRKTGEGKSAVVLTAAMLLRGITLVVVPLLGLGCDQVAKAQRTSFKVESYHLDENRGEDQLAIQRRLLSITYRRSQSIILFASPQSLRAGSSWAPLLQKLAARQLYTLLVCDEAHTIPLHGRSFRKEFIKMRKGVLKSVFLSNPSIPVLAMSASFRLKEQKNPRPLCW